MQPVRFSSLSGFSVQRIVIVSLIIVDLVNWQSIENRPMTGEIITGAIST